MKKQHYIVRVGGLINKNLIGYLVSFDEPLTKDIDRAVVFVLEKNEREKLIKTVDEIFIHMFYLQNMVSIDLVKLNRFQKADK